MNHKLIDHYNTGDQATESPWKFVRVKVLGYEPGNPKGCPHNVFPEPPESTERMPVQSIPWKASLDKEQKAAAVQAVQQEPPPKLFYPVTAP